MCNKPAESWMVWKVTISNLKVFYMKHADLFKTNNTINSTLKLLSYLIDLTSSSIKWTVYMGQLT